MWLTWCLSLILPSLAICGDGTTLKDAAAGTGMKIGAKIQYKYERSYERTQFDRFPGYEKNVLREYNYVTVNSCYPRWDIGPKVKTLDVSNMDQELIFDNCWFMANFSQEHDIDYRIHVLNWFKPGSHIAMLDSEDYTLDEKKLYLREYTKKVMAELGPDVESFDVINEFIEDDAGGGKRNFIDGVSTENEMPDIACEVFLAAKEERQRLLCGVDSDSVILQCDAGRDHSNMHLVYNDYNHMCAPPCNTGHYNTNDKAGRVFSFIQDLAEKRCGIDTVGFQMHINRFFNDFEGVRRNIQRYAEIGIAVQFTEVDVRCGSKSGKTACEFDDPDAQWTDQMLQDQAYVWGEILKVCLEEPNCDSFVMWDAADGVASWDATLAPMNPYLFDKSFKTKIAYDTVLKTLNEFPRDHPAVQARLTGSWRNVEVWDPIPVMNH